MRFDDRIKTVLDHPVAGDRDRAVRWRQLIDLLSRARSDSDPDLVTRALELALHDRDAVPDSVRAATARAIAGRPVDTRLVALFAADRLDVAAPLIAAANLDEAGRAQIAAVASDEVRNLFFALGGAPLPAAPDPLELTDRAEPAPQPSIHELVARIERRRQVHADPAKTAHPERNAATKHAAEAQELTLFRWESDPAGSIAWVDGAPRAALIGRALAGHPGEALLGEESRALLNRRAPFIDVPMASGEPFAGEWRVSGAPAFSTGEGRFIGYRGIARRMDFAPPRKGGRRKRREADDADALRELVHEIKTPLNAIIGFAEIIDGQFLGPAHRNYRQRAAGIVSQARSLLAAVEDLDLAAKLQAGRKGKGGTGTEFAELFPRLADELNVQGASRGVGLVYRLEGTFACCSLEPELAERMVRRFLGALIDAAMENESLRVAVAPHGGQCGVSVDRPKATLEAPADQLFDPAFGRVGESPIGLGFALRLVRGLAQSVGGDLKADDERFLLLLPAKR